MPPVITAHAATIQTATVEIQVMRIGKKQVTMGMFRQLPYRTFVDWPAVLGRLDDGLHNEAALAWAKSRQPHHTPGG